MRNVPTRVRTSAVMCPSVPSATADVARQGTDIGALEQVTSSRMLRQPTSRAAQ